MKEKRKSYVTVNNLPGRRAKILNEPSKTIPDMSYSIRDLLNRFTRHDMPLGDWSGYDTDSDVELNQDTFQPIDMVEVDELGIRVKELQSELTALQNKYKVTEKAKQTKRSEVSEANSENDSTDSAK